MAYQNNYQNGYQAPAPYQAQPQPQQYQQPYQPQPQYQQAPQNTYAPQQYQQVAQQAAAAPQQRYNNAPAQQAPRQQNEKVYYSENFLHKPYLGEMKDAVLVTTGFVEKVAFREVNTQTGLKKVANIDLTATLGDTKVRNAFGEQFVRPDHRVRFHIAFWGKAAENVQSANYAQGTLLRVGMTAFESTSFQKQDGSTGYALNAQGFDFPLVVKEGKGKAANQGQRPAQQVQQRPPQAAAQPRYQQAPQQQMPPQGNYYQQQPMPVNPTDGLFEDGMSSLGALTENNPFFQ